MFGYLKTCIEIIYVFYNSFCLTVCGDIKSLSLKMAHMFAVTNASALEALIDWLSLSIIADESIRTGLLELQKGIFSSSWDLCAWYGVVSAGWKDRDGKRLTITANNSAIFSDIIPIL